MRHKSSFLRLLTIGAFVVSFTPSVVLALPSPNGNYRFIQDYDPDREVQRAGGPSPARNPGILCITFTSVAAKPGYTARGTWAYNIYQGTWDQIGDRIYLYGFNPTTPGATFAGIGTVQAATNMAGYYAEYDYKVGQSTPSNIGANTGPWIIAKDTACP